MEGLDPEVLQAGLVRLAVVVLMVSLGLRVPLAAIVAAGRQGRAFAATLAVGLVGIPALAWVVVHALALPDAVAVGVLLVAAAPGGSLGLKLVDLADGDVALGLGLFFVLALIAPFAVPFTAALLVGAHDTSLQIDALPLVLTLLVIQLVPLVIALAVARVAPSPARRLAALSTTATTVLLVALIATALTINFDDVLAIGAGGVLAYLLLIAGALAGGWLLGQGRPGTGVAIGLLSAQRSTSLALLIATSLGVPAVTGAVVAGGLVLLVVNPLVARLLAGLGPAKLARRSGIAPST